MITPDQDYSDPDTGNIQPGSDWLEDSKLWAEDLATRLETLTPVHWDEEGEYWA